MFIIMVLLILVVVGMIVLHERSRDEQQADPYEHWGRFR